MTKFTMDNTSGYSAEQLTELNRRYDAALEDAALDQDDVNYESTCDHIAETVQKQFDTEHAETIQKQFDAPHA